MSETFDTGFDTDPETGATATETVKIFNPNAGLHGRDGGPYYDEIQSLEHERLSAAREGSTPDYDNPRPGTAIQGVTEAQLLNITRPVGLETTTPTVEPIGTAPVFQVKVPEGTEPIAEPGTGEENGGKDGVANTSALTDSPGFVAGSPTF